MAKKTEPTKPTTWTVYKLAAKQVWLGEVEAINEAEAVAKMAAERSAPGWKLMAIPRRR